MDWLRRILSLWLNLSSSIPLGVYHTIPAPPRRGSIVVVCLPATLGLFARQREYLGRGRCPGGVERLGKRVAAVAGDTVEVGAEGVRINGFLIPDSRPLANDTRGRPLPHAPRRVVVGAGALFLLSTGNRRSFDGRYFGAVTVSDLIVVAPLVANGNRVGPLEHTAEPADGKRQLDR